MESSDLRRKTSSRIAFCLMGSVYSGLFGTLTYMFSNGDYEDNMELVVGFAMATGVGMFLLCLSVRECCKDCSKENERESVRLMVDYSSSSGDELQMYEML